MRVFISYAHSDAWEFADRIHRFLAERLHEVWMDQTGGIQTGERYDVAIERGLQEAEAVVVILSPAAVREGGFCRNEICYALDHSKLVIPIKYEECVTPVQIYTIQQINYQQLGDAALLELAARLESPLQAPNLAVAGSLDFARELARAVWEFSPRDWLVELICNTFQSEQKTGVLLTGLPGTGKSAFLAHLAGRQGEVGALYLCRSNNEPTRDPRQFIASIATQLAMRIPEYGQLLGSALQTKRFHNWPDMLTDILVEPLRDLSGVSIPTWVVVDSLDEARSETGEGIAEILAAWSCQAPGWLKFVCSSRPNKRIQRELALFKFISLENAQSQVSEDLRQYLQKQMASEAIRARLVLLGISPEKLANQLIDRSGGSFLYVKASLRELSQADLNYDKRELIPSDIRMLYMQSFRGRFQDVGTYRGMSAPMLELVAFAQQPLRMQTIAKFLKCDSLDVRRVLNKLEGFLQETGEIITIGQRTLREWLTDPVLSGEYCLSETQAKSNLNRACANWDLLMSQGELYGLRWGPFHALQVADRNAFGSFLLNQSYRHEFKRAFGDEEWSSYLAELAEAAGPNFLNEITAVIDQKQDPYLAADLGLMAYRQERFEEAQGLFDIAIRHAEQQRQWDLLAESLARRGWIESSLGRTALAEAWYRRCRDVAQTYGSERGLMIAYQHFARIYQRNRRFDESKACYEHVIELAKRLNKPDRLMNAMCASGNLLMEQGQIAEALELLGKASILARERHSHYHLMVADTLWARAAMKDPTHPEVEIRRALENALRIGETRRTARGIGEACQSLGELAIREGQTKEARDLLQRAVLAMWAAGLRFARKPLELFVPLTVEGDRYASALNEIRAASSAAGCPSPQTLQQKIERENRETVTAVTLIGARPLPEASRLLALAKKITDYCSGVSAQWITPEALHFTIMPLKRHNRRFAQYPPPLSIVCALASVCSPFRIAVSGALVTPTGGIVLCVSPEDQNLALFRLGLKLLLPEVDDSEFGYFPHITLGHLTHLETPQAFNHFRQSLERAFQELCCQIAVREVSLVNYSFRNLQSIRGIFTWPLGNYSESSNGILPSDQEISGTLGLKQGFTDSLLANI